MTDRRLLTPIVKALLDASDYIEAHGHCKGQYRVGVPPYYRVCAVGSLYIGGVNATADAAIDRLARFIDSEETGRLGAQNVVVRWNDVTASAEVIATMREAAISGDVG